MKSGLAERPTFDSLLVELLVHCLQPAPDRLESRIQAALRRCVAFLEVDCGSLSLAPLQPGDLPLNLAYEEPGVLLPDFEATRQRFPWLTQAGGRGGKILLPRPAGRMGSDAQTVTEREFATQTGICACALLPIEVTGGGWLRFLSVRRPREWPEELVERLGALGTVLATAWRREQAAAGHMTVPHQAAQQRPSAADASPAVRDSAEGQAAEASTASQLRFERLISSISARIGKVEPWEVNREIQRGLSALREFFTVDRCRLLGVSPDRQSLEVIETCAAERAAPLPPGHPGFAQAFPWMFRQVVHAGHCLSLPRLDQLPEAACQDRAACQRQNLQSVFLIPLSVSGAVRFVLSLVAVQQPHMWLEEYIPRLRLLGEIFVNALARKQTEEKIRQSEDFNRTVLASLQDHVAILDRAGNILAVNEAWVNFGRANNAPTGSLGVGWNYLAACQHAADDDPDAAAALQGIETVLQGTQPEFLFDYRCDSPQEQRWFEMVVQPLRRPEGGAVISHTNVTRQRKAELEAQRLRQEITHVARVSMMGELTAALAHELKQPLAAILGNTQAAQRLLASDPPDLVEIRDILADIVADDQRAGEIIHRLRGFLTKSTFQPHPSLLS
jgi:PAS domain-containing protein